MESLWIFIWGLILLFIYLIVIPVLLLFAVKSIIEKGHLKREVAFLESKIQRNTIYNDSQIARLEEANLLAENSLYRVGEELKNKEIELQETNDKIKDLDCRLNSITETWEMWLKASLV